MLHPDAAVVLVALVGVAALSIAADALEPPTISAGEAPHHEGARVALVARVLEAHHGERGRFLVLADPHHRLTALAGPGDGPAVGDLVRVVGIVQRMERAWGLSLDRVETLEMAASRALSPGELARAPHAWEGARVLARGELRDGMLVGGDARVRVTGEPPPREDGAWLAAGTFHYREREAAFVLRVDTWTPAS